MRSLILACLTATPALAEELTFDFDGINSIEVRDGVSVTVVPGDEVAVTARAVSGDVNQVVIRKFGPWLAISRETRWFIFPYGRQDEIAVEIALSTLRNLKAIDGATATASGFQVDKLRVEGLQSGAVFVTESDVGEATLYAAEDGAVHMSGTCETVIAEAVIGGTIAAEGFDCLQGDLTTRAGGAIAVALSDFVSLTNAAEGAVSVAGSPVEVPYLPGYEPDPAEESDS